MKRAVFVCAALLLSAAPRVPTDAEPLNAFAREYNRYTGELAGGVIDVKQWAKVEKAWRAIAGEK